MGFLQTEFIPYFRNIYLKWPIKFTEKYKKFANCEGFDKKGNRFVIRTMAACKVPYCCRTKKALA
jgi:hypothetical protein